MFFFGTAFLLVLFTGNTGLLWTGKAITGQETGGVIQYQYRGTHYSIDDVGSDRSGTRTVYIDPSNPQSAVIDTTNARVTNAATVLVPYGLAALLVVFGLINRNRRRRRLISSRERQGAEAYGLGLDPSTVGNLLAQQRAAGRQAGRAPPGGVS